jgi:hypothetical protein
VGEEGQTPRGHAAPHRHTHKGVDTGTTLAERTTGSPVGMKGEGGGREGATQDNWHKAKAAGGGRLPAYLGTAGGVAPVRHLPSGGQPGEAGSELWGHLLKRLPHYHHLEVLPLVVQELQGVKELPGVLVVLPTMVPRNAQPTVPSPRNDTRARTRRR